MLHRWSRKPRRDEQLHGALAIPGDDRDNTVLTALIVAGLALMWLGAYVESHSLAAATGLVLVVGTASAIWYALR